MFNMLISLLIAVSLLFSPVASGFPLKIWLNRNIDSQLANIYLRSTTEQLPANVLITYGSCQANSPSDAHYLVYQSGGKVLDLLVWHVPESIESGGCLSAWSADNSILGRRDVIYVDGPRLRAQQKRRLRKRQEDCNSISMDSSSGIDSRGPWFDGVEALQSSGISAVDVDAAKSKHIAIVGAGMAGLMIWLVLHEAGFTNITILESSQELGGRVQRQYFGDPSARQYQEMGPMRFPQAIQYAESNETVPIKDHLIVTDLVTELNRRNKQNPDYNISMIQFINNSPNGIVYANGIRLPNGDLPTVADTEADPSLIPQPPSPPKVAEINQVLNSFLSNQTSMALLARNIFAAYKEWQLHGLHGLGGDSFSEFSYVHNYLNYSLESTLIASTAPGFGGWPFWDRLYKTFYFGATDWKTIDGGMQKLPNAFHPLVDQHTIFNAKVDGVSYNISPAKST